MTLCHQEVVNIMLSYMEEVEPQPFQSLASLLAQPWTASGACALTRQYGPTTEVVRAHVSLDLGDRDGSLRVAKAYASDNESFWKRISRVMGPGDEVPRR